MAACVSLVDACHVLVGGKRYLKVKTYQPDPSDRLSGIVRGLVLVHGYQQLEMKSSAPVPLSRPIDRGVHSDVMCWTPSIDAIKASPFARTAAICALQIDLMASLPLCKSSRMSEYALACLPLPALDKIGGPHKLLVIYEGLCGGIVPQLTSPCALVAIGAHS